MIQLSPLIQRIRYRYDAASSVRVTDAAIVEALNEGLDELAESTGFYERWCNVPLKTGQTYYDLRGYWPEDMVGVSAVWNGVSSRWLKPATPDEFGYARWRQVTGDPRNFWMRGLYWLGIFPRSDADSGTLRVYFKGLVPQISTNQPSVPDVPDDFDGALEDYALYELYSRDHETVKALMSWQRYKDGEDALKKFVQNRTTSARHGRIGG